MVKLFKTPFAPSKVTAKNDYYDYINYQWIANKSKELQEKNKYYVQADSFRITQEKVYYELFVRLLNTNKDKVNSLVFL